MNEHLLIIESADGWRVEHAPTQRPVATFKTEAAARKFYGEVAGLVWDFRNPLKCPTLTLAGRSGRTGKARREVDAGLDTGGCGCLLSS